MSRSGTLCLGTLALTMNARTQPLAEPSAVLSEALLRRFDTPGPRYTSYPTADRFV